ncbi:hypothetical protein D3C71_1532860 [compost metagenome]
MLTLSAMLLPFLTVISGSLLCSNTTPSAKFGLYSLVTGSSSVSPTSVSLALASASCRLTSLGTFTSGTTSLAFTYHTTPVIARSRISVSPIHSAGLPHTFLLVTCISDSLTIRSSPRPFEPPLR